MTHFHGIPHCTISGGFLETDSPKFRSPGYFPSTEPIFNRSLIATPQRGAFLSSCGLNARRTCFRQRQKMSFEQETT